MRWLFFDIIFYLLVGASLSIVVLLKSRHPFSFLVATTKTKQGQEGRLEGFLSIRALLYASSRALVDTILE